MEFKDIKSIVDLMKKNSISDFELEKEDFKIKLHRTDGNKTDNVKIQNYLPPGTLQPAPIPVSEQPATETPKTESTVTKDPEIKSPMIGTFYRAPSPESDDYVQVGDHVNADSVVCIVEAMKVMNEIKAEISGVITEIVAENASAVEYGQPLFRVRPA
ncbi:MAG: acetyl-CoA carboxylase, biotin carboxyl carrier protein [Opitutia bacterium TMED67]|nr:acetyl-CoA carboxylase, biotin carboxyl carrier protein [Verrucomicrobiales bacterium]OUU71412.1 MAG: acetyl-CoA carboxylase, biotin carboxyl carrier protein [Opitutae bacterium TMED67]